MDKITEKLLLEKGSPRTTKLEQIKTLNLSKLALKLEDLPVKLLSRLRALERWDLSGNRLEEFPRSLELPALKHLDLSNNQLENVTSLEAVSNLEELKLEDNLYITVSDNHKLMVLLPKLRMYNGKDITSSANYLRFVYRENLQNRISAIWEKHFRLPDPVTAEKLSSLRKEFVNTACQQVRFGPSSISDFTKWRVEIMAKEYLISLTEPKKEPEIKKSPEPKETQVVSTPTKRKEPPSSDSERLSLMPRKKLRNSDLPESPAESSPRKPNRKLQMLMESSSSSVRISPRNMNQPPLNLTPLRGAGTPRRAAKVQLRREEEEKEEKKKKKVLQKETDVMSSLKICRNTLPVSLKPLHVLQCHSKQDSQEDFSTQLWACAFQPQTETGSGGRLVATCGGDSLCVIDCETGMVMKKYKVSGEEFFSLAWSTVLMTRGAGVSSSAQPCSILAAGGKRGQVKLIHPRNNVAFGEFRASRKALSVLRFNQRQGNFLFTGSYDNKIVMWDVGGVDSQYNYKVIQLLMLDVSSPPLHICLPPSSPSSQLLTACEDGLHFYNTQLGTNSSNKSRSKEMEITFPVYKKEDKDHDYHTIDGLSFLTDDIVASKNFMHGSIYLWSWSRTIAQRPDKKNSSVSAVVLTELQWTNTEIPYLALNTCPGRGYIVCGDDKGRLWTYHITDLQKNSFQSGKPIQPTQVLDWPAPVRKGFGGVEGPSINSVAMDPELQYLVALSDKNMVIVWKREEAC